MRDIRIFHIDDPNWFEMFNNQGSPIMKLCPSWTDSFVSISDLSGPEVWSMD
jgi:hypothetical protein